MIKWFRSQQRHADVIFLFPTLPANVMITYIQQEPCWANREEWINDPNIKAGFSLSQSLALDKYLKD